MCNIVCAHLVFSGASLTMLSCELRDVGLRKDRLKREVEVKVQLISVECMHYLQ